MIYESERIAAGGSYNDLDLATFYCGGTKGYTDYTVLAGACQTNQYA